MQERFSAMDSLVSVGESRGMTNNSNTQNVLVLGGTGKTGSRVAAQLAERGVTVRLGSRSADIPFDWEDEATWAPALSGMDAVYVAYQPDLAVPTAPPAVTRFVELAKQSAVQHLVLVSGRGEPEAKACEEIVQQSGLDWTVVCCSWFNQNFSEGAFLDYILAGEVALPAGTVGEPFVDVDDIADVAVAAFLDTRHRGQYYELTGSRLLTFAEAVAEIGAALGREIAYIQIPHADFVAGIREYGVPEAYVELLDYLFGTILDGRNAHLTDGVQRALGRAPRDFADFAKAAAADGAWDLEG